MIERDRADETIYSEVGAEAQFGTFTGARGVGVATGAVRLRASQIVASELSSRP